MGLVHGDGDDTILLQQLPKRRYKHNHQQHHLRTLRLATLTIAAALCTHTARALTEVNDQPHFQKILADNPAVVVDFYSNSCGPCIMIAPVFKKLAQEYKDQPITFVKVNLQTANVGVPIRSMPTFHFYLAGKLDNQFSGAGEQQLRAFTQQLAAKAEAMNVEVSLGALEAFYQKHDPSKLDTVDSIYEKYPAYKLVAILKKKYGEAPEYTQKKVPKKAGGGRDAADDAGAGKAVDIRKMDLDDLKAEVYRREAAADEKEAELAARKNARRRAKMASSAAPVKVAILGGGPAGVSAAIYAARAGLKPVVVAPASGGQLMSKGVNVENYPGIHDASGGDIIKLMKKQALKFDTTFEEDWVTSVDLSQRPFAITTNQSSLTAHAIILATGADSRWLGVKGEEDYKGGGISSCATCDGFLFRDRPVAVVGGGDTAMEEALVLARTSSNVTVIHRRDSFRASKVLADAVLAHPKIAVVWNATVAEFRGGDAEAGGMLTTVVISSVVDGSTTELTVDATFVAIGHIPNTDVVKGQLDMNDSGYLVTRTGSTATSVPGVFAAGDVADWVYRQAVTSAGTGSQAALDAERWLSESMVMGEEEDANESSECYPEDYLSWSMKQIRKELKEIGVDTASECRGCNEKSQFIEVLCRHGGAR